MGQSNSSTLPSADPRVPYFSLTFQTPDKIVLSLANKSVIDLTRSAILDSIPNKNGVDGDSFLHYEGKTEMNTYMFKFRGLPFMRGCGRASSLRATRMCCRILEIYGENGWNLIVSSDLSRAKELTTWFFRRSSEETSVNDDDPEKRPCRRVICVSMNSTDLMRLTNATESARRMLAQAVKSVYVANGIKAERLYEGEDYEIQLTDAAWLSEDIMACIRTRRVILEIIRRFELIGYQFYGTANTKGTSDSLFFISSTKTSPAVTPDSQPPSSFFTISVDGKEKRSGYSYCAISLNNTNCLRLIDAPPFVAKSVLRAIVNYWPPKLKNLTTLEDGASYEFKLGGSPWLGTRAEEATAVRVFLCGLLETLKSVGLEALAALDVTRRVNNKAVFIFRSALIWDKPEAGSEFQQMKNLIDKEHKIVFSDNKPSIHPYWCLSMHDQSTIRFIGAPENLRQILRHMIDQIWPWGVQNELQVSGLKEGYEFKLKSGPWAAEQQNKTALMCYILKALHDQGCNAILSADVTGRFVSNNHGGSHSLDVHSWFVTSGMKSNAGQKQENPNQLRVESKQFPKRRSMPFITRSATFADDFLVSVENGVSTTTDRNSPPSDKEKSETKTEKKKSMRKSSRKQLLRKISTITEYTSRVLGDKT